MRTDNSIYNDIAHILISIAPKNAKKVILRSELSPESDVCTSEYDYIDNDEKLSWFACDSSKASSDLMDYLIELRQYWLVKNLTNGKPIWHGCEVVVDLEKGKIHIDFKYD